MTKICPDSAEITQKVSKRGLQSAQKTSDLTKICPDSAEITQKVSKRGQAPGDNLSLLGGTSQNPSGDTRNSQFPRRNLAKPFRARKFRMACEKNPDETSRNPSGHTSFAWFMKERPTNAETDFKFTFHWPATFPRRSPTFPRRFPDVYPTSPRRFPDVSPTFFLHPNLPKHFLGGFSFFCWLSPSHRRISSEFPLFG